MDIRGCAFVALLLVHCLAIAYVQAEETGSYEVSNYYTPYMGVKWSPLPTPLDQHLALLLTQYALSKC